LALSLNYNDTLLWAAYENMPLDVRFVLLFGELVINQTHIYPP
jgi:hypothetical protein